MARSLNSLLAAIAPFIHPGLIGDAPLARLHALAARLPGGAMGGFEIRLGENQPVVDLFACLVPATGEVPPAFLISPVWRALARLLASARIRGSDAQRFVRRIDLEFDLDREQPALPVPSFFLNLADGELTRGSAGPAGDPTARLLAFVHQTTGATVSAAQRAAVQRCLAHLPAGAVIQYLGFMARGSTALRLVVGGLPFQRLPTYLAAIGWTGDGAALLHHIAPMMRHSRPVGILDLDVAEQVLPTLGVECYVDPAGSVAAWAALLDALLAQGLCTAIKRAALLEWLDPGVPHGHARAALPAMADEPLPASGFLWKSINHVKLVCRDERPVAAKAYLGFGHKP